MIDIKSQLEVDEDIIIKPEPIIKMRAGQRNLFRMVDQYRMLAFVARRQYGKTTSFANIALKKDDEEQVPHGYLWLCEAELVARNYPQRSVRDGAGGSQPRRSCWIRAASSLPIRSLEKCRTG